MSKVREIMSTLPQPVPSNVQELMTSVEQYQKVNCDLNFGEKVQGEEEQSEEQNLDLSF